MNIILLKEYMELRGFTLEQFAQALGVKKSYICSRIKYPDRLSKDDILAMADLLHLRPYEITNVFFPEEAIFSLSHLKKTSFFFRIMVILFNI